MKIKLRKHPAHRASSPHSFPPGPPRAGLAHKSLALGLGTCLLLTLTGCVGYVDGGYGGGGVVVAPEPDVYVFGGGYEHGRDWHDYSHRGFVSRGAVHGGDGGRRH